MLGIEDARLLTAARAEANKLHGAPSPFQGQPGLSASPDTRSFIERGHSRVKCESVAGCSGAQASRTVFIVDARRAQMLPMRNESQKQVNRLSISVCNQTLFQQ